MNLDTIEKSIAWQKGYDLTKEIYKLTEKFPWGEKYNMTSQIRRCALSIPSNIAEGRFRSSKKEFKYFLSVAKGSCGELATQLMLSFDFGYIKQEEFEKLKTKIVEIIKILQASIKTLNKSL